MSNNQNKAKFHPLGSFIKKSIKLQESGKKYQSNAQSQGTEEDCYDYNQIENSLRNSNISNSVHEKSFANSQRADSERSNKSFQQENLPNDDCNDQLYNDDEKRNMRLKFSQKTFCKKRF